MNNYYSSLYISISASDFSEILVNLTFTAGESGRELCSTFSVIDDSILEDTEIYAISLSSFDENILIPSPTSSIVILDEIDSK